MHIFMVRWDELRAAAAKDGARWPMPDTLDALNERLKRVEHDKAPMLGVAE